MTHIAPGIDVLRRQDFAALRGRRLGLFTNLNAVDATLTPTVHVLRHALEQELVALFAPEHGLYGARPDGEIIASSIDPRSGLPVHSLYGDHKRPTPEMLAGLDAIVCDIQDIGVRYYTFLWTLTHVLEAAGANGVELIVLDRPNPLGDVVRGPLLKPECASLVGRYPIPIQHGMTIGEVVRMVNATWNPTPAQLTVIPCAGWERSMTWEQTGLPFVPPSPAIAHPLTVRHYPGACLVEGTTFSEGRGTALPFQIVGAPGIDGDRLAAHLNERGWGGVRFRPHYFAPTASKHAGLDCFGVQAHITDPAAFDALRVWLGVICELKRFAPEAFAWVSSDGTMHHFDLLIGDQDTCRAIDAGADLEALTDGWDVAAADFRRQRAEFLLYG